MWLTKVYLFVATANPADHHLSEHHQRTQVRSKNLNSDCMLCGICSRTRLYGWQSRPCIRHLGVIVVVVYYVLGGVKHFRWLEEAGHYARNTLPG